MFLSLTAILPLFCFSQNSEDQIKNKKWLSGFFMTVSQSYLIYDAEDTSPPLNSEPELTNSAGFGLGITSEYKATKRISARASAGLTFNGGYFTYTVTDNDQALYERDQLYLPVTLDGSIHGILTLKEEGFSPFAILGVTGRMPLNVSDDSTEIPASNGFISADLGIGFHKPFSQFNLRPELRYSYALQGLNHVLLEQKTYMHQISLIIGLNG